MRHSTFFWFVLPTATAMILFIALPIISVLLQSVHAPHQAVLVEVETCTPLVGCTVETTMDQEATKALRDAQPLGRFVGLDIFFDRGHLAVNEVIKIINNSTLSYKHVLFEWEQVPSATSYTVTIYHETSGEYITDTVESLIYINDTFLNWNSSYTWYVTPIFSDGNIGSSIEDSNGNTYFSLHIGQTRSNAYAINYNSSQYSNGFTMFRCK